MLRPLTPARCLLLLACVSCILLFTLVPRYDLLNEPSTQQLNARDGIGGLLGTDSGTSGGSSPSTTASSPAASSAPSSPPATTSTPAATTSSQTPAAAASSTTPPATSAPVDTSATGNSSPSSTPTSTTSPNTSSNTNTGSNTASATPPPDSSQSPNTSPPPPPKTSVFTSLSTNAEGETETVLVTSTVVNADATSSSGTPSASAGADQDSDSSKGVSTSTIVGLSVAGGIALLGIIAFVIWKFTRKRFSDDFDDTEAIKWPELNAHGESTLALPTNRTGGTGFETNSEINLARPDSRAGSLAPSAATSAVDLYAPGAAQDPYAVPPLPHLNPNQPYRDDPDGNFYDPYSGPVPQTFAEPPGGEVIPMTQINRARSPAPGSIDAGRRSPGPQAAYYPEGGPALRAMSPGPGVAMSGRMSPGPGPALSGRASPGPGVAYGYAG